MSPSKIQPAARRNVKKAKISVKVAPPPASAVVANKKSPKIVAPVLPGEDARAYRGRLKAWTGSLGPRNAVESYLVERAVVLSWQLDRADRAQLALLAAPVDSIEPDQASSGAIDRAALRLFDAGDSGDRVRNYQLACGHALFSTLDAFSNLRGVLKIREAARESAPNTPSTPVDSYPPPSGGPPAHGTFSTASSSTSARSADVSAALVEILQAVDSAGGVPSSAVPVAESSPILSGRRDAPTDGQGAGARLVESSASADDTPGRTATGPRRRPPIRRIRQAPWSGPGGSEAPGMAPTGPRTSPVRRSHQAETDHNPPDTRRRVGGYAVPLDPSVPITCADRIPVRLRRDASAARLDRSAARPSS
jgi:hypothetical protein